MRPGTLRRLRAALLSPERRRGEQGYVLGVVLVAMMIGLSLITALLGLSFTTQRAAITQQELARERRAADGALEVAVEEIRSNYSPGDPLCDPVSALGTVAMDLGGEASDEVTLECGGILDPTPNAAGDVKVVGDDAPSLQHAGGSALGVVGAITVKKGATFPGTADPALQVAGNYVQGDTCDPSAIPIRDAEGDPECGNSDAQALSAEVTGLTPTTSLGTAPPAVCPADAAGRSFDPGRYGAAQVAQLNWLFENCGGTFRFQPGSYWFDGTLVFRTATVLIGNADETTMTCQPSATTVVLAANATITHQGGRVLLCGDLLQTSEVDDGPKLVNATSPNGRFADPANALSESSLAMAEMSSPPNQLEATIVANGTRPIQGLVLRWSSQEVPPSEFLASRGVWAEFFPPGSSAPACKTYTGSTPGYRGRVHYDSKIGSQLDLLGGSCLGVFSGNQEAYLNGWRLRVSFSQQFPTIAGWPAVLNYCNTTHACKHYVSNMRLLNQVHEVGADSTSAHSGGTAPWSDVAGLTELGGSSSYVVNNCSFLHNGIAFDNYCTRTGTEPSSSFSISGFTLPAGFLDDDKLTSTAIAFDVAPSHANDLLADPSNTASTAVQGSTTVTMSYPDSDGDPATCTLSIKTYLRSRRTYTLDLTSCPDLSTAGQLEQASVDVSIQPEKGAWLTTLDPNDSDEWVGDAGLEMPTLDYVRLIATTNTVNDTVDMTVNVDEASGSSFRVYGNTTLPRANLAVKWAGTATAEALFNGDLIARSVNSTQAPTATEVGVLCCGPMSPTIRVNAYTDAPPGGGQPAVIRGTARIRLEPAAGGTTTVTVADWQLCHLDGCKLNDTVLPP